MMVVVVVRMRTKMMMVRVFLAGCGTNMYL